MFHESWKSEIPAFAGRTLRGRVVVDIWKLCVSIYWFAILPYFLKNNIIAVIPAKAGISTLIHPFFSASPLGYVEVVINFCFRLDRGEGGVFGRLVVS
jgi:hypothetical protein